MFEALAVALGGALGSLGRWQLGVLFKQWIPNLPVGTFAANVVAGLIIGFVTGLDLASPLQPLLVMVVLTKQLLGCSWLVFI